jgi:hypothetical protein
MRRPFLLAVLAAVTISFSVGPAGASASIRLPCLNEAGTKYKPKFMPLRCAHFGPHGTSGGGVNLDQLTWTAWGGAGGTATGIERGFHLPFESIPVQVEVFRVRKECGRRMYTRLRATSSLGSTLVKTKACLGPAF